MLFFAIHLTSMWYLELYCCDVCAGVMHQVKKLCEPDVIDLSAKKTETAASAAASVGDVTSAAAAVDASSTPTSATTPDKRASDTAVPSATAANSDTSKQSCTVAPSGSSPRM